MTQHQDKHLAAQPQTEVRDISDLLTHALALEEEASERYAELAAVMESHNNPEAAALFSKMAAVEQLHVDEIRKQIDQRKLTDLPSAQYRWVGIEGPETTDHADLHYLMTPRQALSLALLNERRARDYYLDIVDQASDPEVIELARELADEEREHVTWVKRWLERIPQTHSGWDQDDDPPNQQG